MFLLLSLHVGVLVFGHGFAIFLYRLTFMSLGESELVPLLNMCLLVHVPVGLLMTVIIALFVIS